MLVGGLSLGRASTLARFQGLDISVISDDASLIVTEVFDPKAFVVVTAGDDGKPGRAGIDDGANGQVDEDFELGATGSDDEMVVFASDARDSVDEISIPHRVLSRGAYVIKDDVSEDPQADIRKRYVAQFSDGSKVGLIKPVK